MSDARLRQQAADYARRLHARGWVANHDGNLTLRLAGGDRYLCTPTATSKAEVTAESLLVLDGSGVRISGAGRPFSELGLHLTVLRHRPDVAAVVHAHPPCATGLAVAGSPLLERPFLAEAVVSLGPGVPTVPFAAPGEASCSALAPFAATHDAVLLANHGVIAWGADLEQAYLRLELVEHLARIALAAHQVGGPRPLPEAVLPALLESRRQAGLGLAASRAEAAPPPPKAVAACAPPPAGSDVVLLERPRASAGALPSASALAEIIRQEIAATLKR